jgi:hypothetical protein
VDKRAQFFFGAAVACFLVAPVGLAEYREIAIGVGVLYLVFALLSFLDHRSRAQPRKR